MINMYFFTILVVHYFSVWFRTLIFNLEVLDSNPVRDVSMIFNQTLPFLNRQQAWV
jgi:hypothetical protein